MQAVVMAAFMQLVVHFIVGAQQFGVVADGCNGLVDLAWFHYFFIKSNPQDMRFLVPLGRNDTVDFGGRFDALFTHVAVTTYLEFGGHGIIARLRLACLESQGDEYDAEKKSVFHDVALMVEW